MLANSTNVKNNWPSNKLTCTIWEKNKGEKKINEKTIMNIRSCSKASFLKRNAKVLEL
jgi:hypothetical protein